MADNLQPTPRNQLLGLLSDAMYGGINYMKDPRRSQQMQGLAGLLESTGIPKTTERMAYGEPLTNIGRANVPLLKPETADALMNVAPLAPMVGKAGKGIARMVGERMAKNVVMGKPSLPGLLAEPRSSLFAVKPQAMPQGGRDADILEDMTKNTASNSIKPMEKVRIYRGSFDNSPSYSVAENYPNDVYGGVFGSSELRSAQAHGNGTIYFTDIPKNKILTHYQLNYEIPYEKTKNALLKARPDLKNNPELFDEVYDIVVGDAGQDLQNLDDSKIIDLFRISPSEAYNETQRLRGQVSKNLGYRAIEMTDEHGSGTYLVAPGAKFKQ